MCGVFLHLLCRSLAGSEENLHGSVFVVIFVHCVFPGSSGVLCLSASVWNASAFHSRRLFRGRRAGSQGACAKPGRNRGLVLAHARYADRRPRMGKGFLFLSGSSHGSYASLTWLAGVLKGWLAPGTSGNPVGVSDSFPVPDPSYIQVGCLPRGGGEGGGGFHALCYG